MTFLVKKKYNNKYTSEYPMPNNKKINKNASMIMNEDKNVIGESYFYRSDAFLDRKKLQRSK